MGVVSKNYFFFFQDKKLKMIVYYAGRTRLRFSHNLEIKDLFHKGIFSSYDMPEHV